MTVATMNNNSGRPKLEVKISNKTAETDPLVSPDFVGFDYGSSSLSSRSTIEEDSELNAKVDDHHHCHGTKSIGMLGSIAIAVNSLAGPAILQLPFQYQQSGIIPTTLCLVAVGVLASLCSLHMANVVSQMPGNKQFDQCVEFSDPFSKFWNQSAFKVTQVIFFLCATCMNVAAIVDTAEVVDSFLGLHFESIGYNAQDGAIQKWSHPPCSRKDVKLGDCEPFGDEFVYGNFLLTAGYLFTAAVFLPICLMDLKENTAWQIFGFSLLVSISMYFCAVFSTYDHLSFHHVTWWGSQWSDMLGVILFNFGLVLAIPAWLHEKRPQVSVNTVVYGSTAISTGLFIAVGSLGALAIPKANVNMLEPMVSGAYGGGMQIAASLFAFFIIGLDIPLFSVLARYNLTNSGLFSESTANLMVVWIPWFSSWILYQGDSIGQLLNWCGVLFTSAVAFILPLYLALRVLVGTDENGSIHVYGIPVRRERQISLLYVTLFLAVCAVTLAIGGQIIATRERIEYLNSDQYINDELLAKSLRRQSHHHHHHHHKHRNGTDFLHSWNMTAASGNHAAPGF